MSAFFVAAATIDAAVSAFIVKDVNRLRTLTLTWCQLSTCSRVVSAGYAGAQAGAERDPGRISNIGVLPAG
jgi:hypothetical protein